jgi:hyperosmotically inducible protein
MMASKSFGTVAVALGVAVSAWVWAAQGPEQKQGVGERVGQKIDRALENIKEGTREAAQAIRNRFERARTAVHDMGIEARIYGRLHWDKDLNEADLSLEVHQGGIAVLRGTVPSVTAKTKAVALTKDTVGVTVVKDELTVSPPAKASEKTEGKTQVKSRRVRP